MKKLLIIASTHGNERIGLEVAKKLEDVGLEKYFDLLIANPEAFKQNKRYLDYDLNRAYPGEEKSKLYEKRIAFENLKIAKKYKYVIDVHEASEGLDNFIIVPKKRLPKKFPIKFINMEKLLLWPDPRGPISQVLENAIELEFGMKGGARNEAIKKCTKIMMGFIFCIEKEKEKIVKQKKYFVYDKLVLNKDNKEMDLRDFQEVKIRNEVFLPLLSSQYLKEGIKCYKMKKCD